MDLPTGVFTERLTCNFNKGLLGEAVGEERHSHPKYLVMGTLFFEREEGGLMHKRNILPQKRALCRAALRPVSVISPPCYSTSKSTCLRTGSLVKINSKECAVTIGRYASEYERK